jgi:hypothetical protein
MKDKDSTLLTEAYVSMVTEMRLDQAMVAVRKAAAADGGYVADVLNDLDPRRTDDMEKPLTNAEFKSLVSSLREIPPAESTPELQAALATIKFDVEEPSGKMPGWTPERDKAYQTPGSEEHGLGDDSFAGIAQPPEAEPEEPRATWLNDFFQKFYAIAKDVATPEETQQKQESALTILKTLQNWAFRANPAGNEESGEPPHPEDGINLVYYGKFENQQNPGPAKAVCTLRIDRNLNMSAQFKIYLEGAALTSSGGLPAGWANIPELQSDDIPGALSRALDPELDAYMPHGDLNRVVEAKGKMAQWIVKKINGSGRGPG